MIPLFMALLAPLPALAKDVKPAFDAAHKPNGLIVRQSREMTGEAVIYTSPNGRRFDSLTGGFSMVSTPPDWKVYIFNEKKKLYKLCVVKDQVKFKSNRMAIFHDAIMQTAKDLVWKKVRSTQFLDHPVDVFRSNYKTLPATARSKPESLAVEYWVATDLTDADPIVLFNNVVNGWPKVNGMALRCIKIYKGGGHPETVMETKSIKPAYCPDSIYRIPAGFKETEDEMAILMNLDLLKDLLD